jgi:hypothetical protein
MAISRGPKIVTNGLVLALDSADRNSYISGSTSWYDLTGNNNGTISGSPLFTGSNGGFLTFNAVNSYVDCGNGSSLNFGTGDFTIEIWMTRNTNATTNLRVLGKGGSSDAAGSAGFAFLGFDGGLNFTVNPSGTRSTISAASYSLGEWFQVVGIVERSSTIRSYKNATLVQSAAAPIGSVSNATFNLNIGRTSEGGTLYWPGNIAIVKIYNRALTATEVLQNYNATKSRFGL